MIYDWMKPGAALAGRAGLAPERQNRQNLLTLCIALHIGCPKSNLPFQFKQEAPLPKPPCRLPHPPFSSCTSLPTARVPFTLVMREFWRSVGTRRRHARCPVLLIPRLPDEPVEPRKL